MQRPEGNVRCLPQWLSTFRFETGSLSLELGVHYLAGLAGQQAPGTLLVSAP